MKKLISKYQIGGWFPIGYDNNIYRPTYGTMLPEVRVVAKGDPRKVNNDYYKAHSRARANVQQAVQEWDDRDRLVLNTMLGVGAAPVIAAHPLSFILGIAGGEGVNTGIRGVSKGRYKDFGEWSSNLITGDNSIAPLTSWLNPGYALAGASRPVVRGVETITRPYRLAKVVKEGLEEGLEEGIKNISNTIIENPAHNRFKLGDAEINNPNLMYHVDNGDFTGFSGNGAYIKDNMLFPGKTQQSQESYSWWNLGSPYRTGQSRLLVTTKDNPNFLKVRDQNYQIGQWDGSKGFVTNSEYVSSNPIKIGSQYIWEPGYGYRKYSNNSNTLSLKDVLDTKTSLTQNISKWTPEQWTAAQDAAIAKGDMAEALRLRDLHFKVSAPNTQIKDIQYHGAKGNAKFNVFDPKLIGQTDQGWAGRGYYFTPSIDYAKMYSSEPRAFYINALKVHNGTASTYFGRENSPAANAFKIIRKRHGNDGQQILDELAASDAIRTSFPQTQPYNDIFEEVVTRNNNQMKLADAVTYDDNGVRIPLGKRDNFNINDIRYSLLPFILGSAYIGGSLK